MPLNSSYCVQYENVAQLVNKISPPRARSPSPRTMIQLQLALRPSRAHEQEEPGDDFTPSPGGAVVVFDWAETLRDILSQTYKNRNITPGQSDPGSSSLSSSSLPLPPPAPNPAHNEESRAETRYHRNDGDKSLATEDVGDSWKGSRRSNSAGSTTGRGVEGGDVGGEAEGFVEIVHGEPFTDRKSTFQAHLARVTSELQVGSVTWRAVARVEGG